jgi:hypothetical protein
MSYLALLKKTQSTLPAETRKPLGRFIRDSKIAVLLDFWGQDVWFISNESMRLDLKENALAFLPDEIEILHKMEPDTIKAVLLVKSQVPQAKLTSYGKYQ